MTFAATAGYGINESEGRFGFVPATWIRCAGLRRMLLFRVTTLRRIRAGNLPNSENRFRIPVVRPSLAEIHLAKHTLENQL
jgi:hypothetical protein